MTLNLIDSGLGTVGTLKKEIKPSETASSSPNHRASVGTNHQTNVELSSTEQSIFDSYAASGISGNSNIQLPMTVEPISRSATLPRTLPEVTTNEADEIVAEKLEKIFEHKSIREKREALEKKIRALKKSHDKKKIEVVQNEIGDGKKSSIFSSNRLVKRLSSKNM